MRTTFPIFLIFTLQLLIGCERSYEKIDVYNKKSNELILQIAKQDNCDCIIEIPKKTLVEIAKSERPNYNIEDHAVKTLGLKSKSEFDSLVRISESFELDTVLLKNNNIKIISLSDVREARTGNGQKLLKKCHKGILWATKPILNNKAEKAIIDCGLAFMCLRGPVWSYEFKDGKWNNTTH